MGTIKSYTDLEQSRKLAEILPLDSADMCWFEGEPFVEAVTGYQEERAESHRQAGMEMYPCWSLAALLSVIPGGQVNRMANSDKWEASSWIDLDYLNAIEPSYYVEDYDNPVDACVGMVETLHKLKLL